MVIRIIMIPLTHLILAIYLTPRRRQPVQQQKNIIPNMVNYLQLYPHCDPALFPGFELPIRFSYTYPNIGILNEVEVPRYPGQVAAIHTHGAESSFLLYGTLGSKVFSPQDKIVAQNIGVPLYLANPYGELRVYYPNLDEDYILPYTVPIDPTVQNWG